MIMVGVILFIVVIVIVSVISIVLSIKDKGVVVRNFKNFEYDSKKQILKEKDKKDGIVIDLKDFEYDSKKEIFLKREDFKHLDDMFDYDSNDPMNMSNGFYRDI